MASEASDAALDSVRKHIVGLEAVQTGREDRLKNIETVSKEELILGLQDFLTGIRKRKTNIEEDIRFRTVARREYGDGAEVETEERVREVNALNDKHRFTTVLENELLNTFPFLKEQK